MLVDLPPWFVMGAVRLLRCAVSTEDQQATPCVGPLRLTISRRAGSSSAVSRSRLYRVGRLVGPAVCDHAAQTGDAPSEPTGRARGRQGPGQRPSLVRASCPPVEVGWCRRGRSMAGSTLLIRLPDGVARRGRMTTGAQVRVPAASVVRAIGQPRLRPLTNLDRPKEVWSGLRAASTGPSGVRGLRTA